MGRPGCCAAFRLRATSQVLIAFLYSFFDMNAAPYYAAGIVLHVLNTWLVFALGAWRRIGYGISAWAALFFAVAEGHQEAVMWISAVSELLQFLFGLTALISWILFLQTSRRRWYAVSIIAFALALISKESAPIFLALMILPLLDHRSKTPWILPYAALTLLALWSVFSNGSDSFRFQDGSFSFHAPFWITLPRSFFAEFWIWGLAALAVLLLWRKTSILWIALAWARTRTASLRLSHLFDAHSQPANLSRERRRRAGGRSGPDDSGTVAPKITGGAIVAVLMLQNIGYLWTRKRSRISGTRRADRAVDRALAASKRPDLCEVLPAPAGGRRAGRLAGSPPRPPDDLIWDVTSADPRRLPRILARQKSNLRMATSENAPLLMNHQNPVADARSERRHDLRAGSHRGTSRSRWPLHEYTAELSCLAQ